MAALKVTDLGDYLREQRKHAKMSLRQLAEQAGVSNPYLSQIERGLRHPSAEVLQQIAKGLRISAEALYVRAGILEDRGDSAGVEAAVLADPLISDRQRRVLLDIYQSFTAENARDAAMTRATVAKAAATKATSRTSTAGKARAKKAPATKAKGTRVTATKAPAKKATGTSTSPRGGAKRSASTPSKRPPTTGGN